MTKAWLVSSGSYSDYSVGAVFSTEEKAKDYVARVNAAAPKSSYRDPLVVEERDLDPEGPPYGVFGFSADVTRAGDILRIRASDISAPDYYVLRDSPGVPGGGWSICVFARDEDHAKKIVTEKRQQLLAEEALSASPT